MHYAVTRVPLKTRTVVQCEELRGFKHCLPMSHLSLPAVVTRHLSDGTAHTMQPWAAGRSDQLKYSQAYLPLLRFYLRPFSKTYTMRGTPTVPSASF